jgi:hypothetical protein
MEVDSDEPSAIRGIGIGIDLVIRIETGTNLIIEIEVIRPKLRKLFPLQTRHFDATLWHMILPHQLFNKH